MYLSKYCRKCYFQIHLALLYPQLGLVQNLGLKAAIAHLQKPQGKSQPNSTAKWQKLVKFYAFS